MDVSQHSETSRAGPGRQAPARTREMSRARRAARALTFALRCGEVINSPWWSYEMLLGVTEQSRAASTTHLRWHWFRAGRRLFWSSPEAELGAFLEALAAHLPRRWRDPWLLELATATTTDPRGSGPLSGLAWFLSGGDYRDHGYRGPERGQALELVWRIIQLDRDVGGARDLLELGVGLDGDTDYLAVVSRVLDTLEALGELGGPAFALAREIGGRAKLAGLDELLSLVAVTLG